VKISGIGAGLHDKDVRAAHVFQNLKINFAVAELAEFGFTRLGAQVTANIGCQTRIRASAENFEFIVGQNCSLTFSWKKAELFRRNPARPIYGGILPSKLSSRRKPDPSEMPEQLGAPSLGFGIFQTPPNRYPPARPLQLLAEAIPV
jgi:hypothetical protein